MKNKPLYTGLENDRIPLISIVMPIYNSNKIYLRKSISSCLNQTYQNIELIIVEDGSEKDSEELITGFRDNRIKYVKKPKNEKLPRALNTGFSVSKGQYLTWTSDDNIFAENAIEIMYNFLYRNPEYDFVYSNYYLIDEMDEKIQPIFVYPSEKLTKFNCTGSCFLYSRKVYEVIGEYNPDEFLVEDYDYWIRVSKQFNMKNLDEFLYYHRWHSNSLTGKFEFKAKLRACQIRKKHFSGFNSRKDFAIFYYDWGVNLYSRKEFIDALKLLLKSFILNPFYILSRIISKSK